MLEYLRYVPFRAADGLRYWIRNTFATTEWPEDLEHVTTPIDTFQADSLLQNAHFEDASDWSLKYEGEVLNLRRPAGVDENGIEQEDHLRARYDPEDASALQWAGHREANRYTERHEHVHEIGLEWLPADRLARILVDAGVPVEAPAP